MYNRFIKKGKTLMYVSLQYLIELGAIRKSLFGNGYVVYTENGPVDVSLSELEAD